MLSSTAIFIQPVGAQQADSSQVSFGAIQNLSLGMAGNDTAPVVATVGSQVYVAWEDNPAKGHPVTYFTTSGDNGTSGTWSTPIAFSGLSGGATPQTSAVQIAASGSNVFLTWEQGGQTAYAISTNNGALFNYGLFTVPSTLTGSMSGEVVSACGNYAYFTWADILSSNTKDKPIVFIQAHVSSGTFALTTAVSLSSTNSAHEEDENACSGNYVYVVWDSIYFTRSSNNGVTFPKVVQLKPSGGSGGALSREPMVSASGPNVYVTFPSDSTPDGSYQTYVVVSNNYGSTFAPAKDLSYGYLSNAREIQVTSNYYKGQYNVYITSRGESATVSGTQQYIYVSNNAGITFTPPILLGPKLPNPENGFGGVAVDGNNVYVQWVHNAKSKGVQQTFFAASQDNGTTWAPNQQLSSSGSGVVGYGDPAGGQGPLIAAGLGNVYVVWQDNTTGGGDIYFISSAS